MPCRPAPTPVNIVVQAWGVSGCVVERSTPEAPCPSRRSRWGTAPAARSGSSTSGVIASRPMTVRVGEATHPSYRRPAAPLPPQPGGVWLDERRYRPAASPPWHGRRAPYEHWRRDLVSPSAANREFPERTDAAVTSDTPLQQLLRAVVRFWWVALLGIVLAVLAFTFATYRVTMSFPPKLEARAHSTYSASTQLLITSKGEPYLSSTNVNAKIIKLPDSTTASTTGTATGTQQNSTYDSGSGADVDLQRLVE